MFFLQMSVLDANWRVGQKGVSLVTLKIHHRLGSITLVGREFVRGGAVAVVRDNDLIFVLSL